MRVMRTLPLRTVALLGSLAAAAALAVAHGTEIWGGLPPCPLCLWQRWPYRVAVVLGIVGALAPTRFTRAIILAMVVTIAADAAVAAVHVGVELGAWPSPLPSCYAPTFRPGASIAERLAAMPFRPDKPCDEPTFLIPGLPLSMAAMNLIYALVFAATLAVPLFRPRRRA
jgi:disulfide bond formation protein DsbB